MVQRHLGDVRGHMLQLGIERNLCHSKLEKASDGGMADHPTESLQDMPFHLREHVVLVQGAAHGLELANGWDTVLAVTILSSNEQRRTADKLVVALVHHSAGAVTVEDVNGKMESLRKQMKCMVSFEQEVQ